MKDYKLLLIFLFLIQAINFVSANPVRIVITSPEEINANSEFSINIEIQKENIEGFAKLELFLPVGIKPISVEASGTTYIIRNDLLKIIWLELPEKTKFNISVKFSVDKRISGYKELYGNFHYLINKERKKYSVGIVPFMVRNDNNFNNSTSELMDEVITKIVVPEKILDQSLVYRVQIAAFKRKLSKDVISELYIMPAYVKEEIIDGLYKYTIGDFAARSDADIFRKKCGIHGAFIVKYENGKRIK